MSLSKREMELEWAAEQPEGIPEGFEPHIPAPIERITNKFNLPLPLVAAVSNDKYSPGHSDYTTTQLAGTPARQLVLKRKFASQLTEDVTDRIYSLSGQSKHVVLERAAEFCEQYEYLAEERFYIIREGKVIGGQIDLYDKQAKVLWDWKETGVYVSYHAVKPEWEAQGNINRLLLEENGYPVEAISNIALYRDWKKSQVGTKAGYPEHQVEKFSIDVWPKEKIEEFISKRIAEMEAAKVDLPLCSDEERWKSPDVFALTKKGNKRATKLFDSEQEAKTHVEIFSIQGHEISFRPGVNKRCESYCVVMPHCEQAKRLGVGTPETAQGDNNGSKDNQ